MNTWKKRVISLLVSLIIALASPVLLPQHESFAGHEIYLRDLTGTPVAIGGNTPYSPKQTCGMASCHIDMIKSFGLSSGNIYESGIGYAQKDHGSGTSPYSVPYPQHGVSAGFHFQKGRSMPWGQVQRNYYGTPEFSSSPGMYGKFCLSTSRRLADLNQNETGFDMSTYDFSHGECSWCHAGGGPLEYDREGYRYDGLTGLFKSGANPSPKNGDYFSFDAETNTLVSRAAEWQSGGVGEVDCLLCHLKTQIGGFRFSMLERNFAISEAGGPGLAASLGLAGPAGTTGLLRITRQGDASGNPVIDPSGWSWITNLVDIKPSPEKENCALCHFADKSLMTPGPAGLPLGYTVMQKLTPANTVPDGDNASGGTNAEDWKIFKLRAEADKRAESINEGGSSNFHMEQAYDCTFCHSLLGAARDYNNDCVTCHYEMWGYPSPPEVTPVTPQVFPAVVDSGGNTVLPALEVLRIDHQLAKGNNRPDGMLMDQLDNTVTCESCHITRTHSNAGAAQTPGVGHAGFPAFHFSLIDCRTCHIPVLNGPIKRTVQDYTAGPYQGGDRNQLLEDLNGIKPLYVWRRRNTEALTPQITPVSTLTTAIWQNRASGGTLTPVLKRSIQQAAESFRASQGITDGIYNWTLNRPQNGDVSFIMNTEPEISGMVNELRLQGEPEPVMSLVFEQFVMSHNEETVSSGKILGAPSGGGCLMCHSSSDPASPNYSPKAVAFFDKKHVLFTQPVDGGQGIVQTSINDAAGNPVKRVEAKFIVEKKDGSALIIDLSNNDGQTIGNEISQGDMLGYDAAYLAELTNPETVGIPKTTASFAWNSDATVSRKVNFDASSSVCSGACTYSWLFGDGALASGLTTSHFYAAAGMYSVTLVVEDSQYGLSADTTSMVEAKTVNTAPIASKTAVTVANMTASFRDASTDAESAQAELIVTVNWGDGTTTTGSGGDLFTKTYSAGGSYVIRHSVTDTGGLSGSSPNTTVSISEKYTISGRIADGSGAPLPGAKLSLKIGYTIKSTTLSAADGTYSFNNLLKACYTVLPSMTGKTFTPSSKYLCVGPSATDVNYISTP